MHHDRLATRGCSRAQPIGMCALKQYDVRHIELIECRGGVRLCHRWVEWRGNALRRNRDKGDCGGAAAGRGVSHHVPLPDTNPRQITTAARRDERGELTIGDPFAAIAAAAAPTQAWHRGGLRLQQPTQRRRGACERRIGCGAHDLPLQRDGNASQRRDGLQLSKSRQGLLGTTAECAVHVRHHAVVERGVELQLARHLMCGRVVQHEVLRPSGKALRGVFTLRLEGIRDTDDMEARLGHPMQRKGSGRATLAVHMATPRERTARVGRWMPAPSLPSPRR